MIQCQTQNKFILEFEKIHPGISPQNFLDSVKDQIRVLGEKKKKLKGEKQQREEELCGLENKKISASLEINRAWSESIPDSAEKLWEVVQAVNPTNKALILKKNVFIIVLSNYGRPG